MSEAPGVEAAISASRWRLIHDVFWSRQYNNPLAVPGSSELGHQSVSGFLSSYRMLELSRHTPPRDIRSSHSIFLLVLTIVILYLSGRILRPFVASLAWSAAFAILLSPLANRICARIHSSRGMTASILTFALGIGITIPSVWAARLLIDATISGISAILPLSLEQVEQHYPNARKILEKLESTLQISASLGQFLGALGLQTRALITVSLWSGISILLTLFTFFYMIRDGERLLHRVEEFMPLSGPERTLLYTRISDTIHATLFGSVMVSALQGFLGGLLIWWLNVPGAALWGLIMALLALVPYLGAFVVWIPLAALLLVQGRWHDAILATAWGSIVIGLSDNLLYPILVGKRLRYHSLLVFFFLVGGVWCFGAAGIIIGPVVLAVVDTTIDIWRGTSPVS